MKKIKAYLYTVLFLVIVIGLGSLSFLNLARFYIFNEVDYNEWSPELGNRFETNIASTFVCKFGFVNFNGAVEKVLNQPYMNDVVKLNNGYLVTPMEYTPNEVLQSYAELVAKFNTYLKERGTAFVYASTPYTTDKYDPELPLGIEEYSNDNADRFVELLNDYGVDTIDFRETMHNDGINQYDMMYKTDHHWTTEAGLYAYGVLEEYIKTKTGCETDERVSDINYYNVTNYKNWHLGSRGQRTGIYYAGIDDFNLITPKFNTKLKNSEGTIGTMQELMINTDPLFNKNYESRYTYDYVMNKALGDYENLLSKNDVKILLITDSFGKVVSPYLAMGFSNIKYFSEGIINSKYIEDYDPDVVIVLYYPFCLRKGGTAFSIFGF